MRDQAIKDLVGYAARTGLIEESDRTWAANALLEAMRLDSWEEPQEAQERPLEDILRELLDAESYVCVGRAADFVLKDKPNVLTVYIDAPYEDRIEREMKRQGIGRNQAIRYIDKLDHYRESYYKYHTGRQWKRVENYDLCLDSAAIGLDNCVEVIKKVIELRFGVKCSW